MYIVDLDPAKGAEIKKPRRAVIISPNAMNKHLKTVLIAPLTHTLKGYPSRVPSSFGNQRGEIVLDQVRGIDKSRLKKKLGTLDTATARKVKAVLVTMFS